jgi:hypothetical protein
MHKVGGIRRVVVFCTSFIPGRCATLPRFVTDETGGSSICKRRGNQCGAAIALDDVRAPFIIDTLREHSRSDSVGFL